jgi:hypothetical protein
MARINNKRAAKKFGKRCGKHKKAVGDTRWKAVANRWSGKTK